MAGTWQLRDRPNKILGEEPASGEMLRVAGQKRKSIISAAEWLLQVVRKHKMLSDDVRRSAVTRIAHARFLAIAIMLRDFDPETERRLLNEWERITFRIFGLGGADKRNKVGEYVRLGYDVVREELDQDAILKGITRLGRDHKIENVVYEGIWTDCYDGWTEELRYLLYRYDEHLAKEAGEDVDTLPWNKIWEAEASKSIEHISPQSAGKDYMHELGNLTMLPPGINSRLRDRAPTLKTEAYLTAGIRATALVGKSIETNTHWRKSDVQKRTKAIAAFVVKEWGDPG